MLVGPYANGKTMIAERFAVTHLKASESQRVWVVQTREGAGLAHFYAKHPGRITGADGKQPGCRPQGRAGRSSA